MVWCKSAFCRWKFDTSWLFTLHGWRVFPFLRTDSTDAPSLGWSNSFYHTKPNLARPMKKTFSPNSIQSSMEVVFHFSIERPGEKDKQKQGRDTADTWLTVDDHDVPTCLRLLLMLTGELWPAMAAEFVELCYEGVSLYMGLFLVALEAWSFAAAYILFCSLHIVLFSDIFDLRALTNNGGRIR